ncbi:DNA invertase Pin-like site-specific DNA recombinase [Winogradskyella pacifica]|uniref:DNA invertase Pin-like site-specific DNA recombinase n=1 Tax=Winogradskyella pacifica TaxID=664642 RepID=A0A3D9LKH6_9FLAO|nr:recombinase family protein [Winogradskyella pacifica]REE07868.1 DNA invertase Pin-like site-specific DNA recombinase [Winogradskyella pacifica]
MKARYNRISTTSQKLDRQTNKANSNELIFNDVISGSIPFKERPEGLKLIEAINEGQINYVSVSSIDRLGRNTLNILETIQFFNDNAVTLKVDNLGIESLTNGKPNSTFNLIISVMANVSQMERETLLERQREGIAIAKANGTYKGRVKGSTESKQEFLSKHKEVVKHLKAKQSLRNTAKLSNVSLGTVQKVKKLVLS